MILTLPPRAAALIAAAGLCSGCLLTFDAALLDAGGGGGRAAVPGGTFDRSYDRSEAPMQDGEVVAGWQHAGAATATVSAFELDVDETTVRQFRAFVDGYDAWRASGNPKVAAGALAARPGSGWLAPFDADLPANATALRAALKCDADLQTFTDADVGRDARAINCVSWFEAFAYCIWADGRLPTEAEWNFAAAAGDEHRAFPWSSPPASLTVGPTYAVAFMTGDVQSVASKAPTDTGRWAHHDLAGNVREWVLDVVSETPEDGYVDSAVAPPCVDCVALSGGPNRGRRGGAYDTASSRLRTAYRSSSPPGLHGPFLGVRCAR